MLPNSRLAVAAAIIAFSPSMLVTGTDCTATATVTAFSTITACTNSSQISTTSILSSSSVSSNLTSTSIFPTISINITSLSTSPPRTLTTPVILPSNTPLDCQADNCLRHFERFSTDLSPFCATYTTSVSTATNFPSLVENCDSNPSRVSSACSCIHTGTTPSPTPSSTSTHLNSTTSRFSSTTLNATTASSHATETSTLSTSTPPVTTSIPLTTSLDCHPDNCLRHFDGHSMELAPFCATYTTSPSTATVFPANIVNCENASQVSSACSCINTDIPGAVGYTPAPTSTPTISPGSTVVGNSGTSLPTSASVCGVSVIFETRTEVTTVFTTVGVSGVGSTSESSVLSTSESSTSSSVSSTSSLITSQASSAGFSSTLTADPVRASDGWSGGWSEGWRSRKDHGGRNHAPWGRVNWGN